MELVRGIARNVRGSATQPHQEGTGPVNLDGDGRAVRLDMPECPWPVRDGDDIIVAGEGQANVLVGYAYKDLTQGYLSRASCRTDAVQGSLILLFGVAAFWLGWTAHNEIS